MTIAACFASVFITTQIARAQNVSDATRAIDAFCREECEGKQERYDNCKFSRSYINKKDKEGYQFGGKVNLWDFDPYIIVESYEIVGVRANGNKASAVVRYKKIGYSTGKGNIVAEKNDRDVVEYNMIFKGSRWWVWNPPLPRIFKKDLLEFLRADAKIVAPNWLERPDITEFQKQAYRNALGTIKAIEELPN